MPTYRMLRVVKLKVRAILVYGGVVDRFYRMFAPAVRKEHYVVRLKKLGGSPHNCSFPCTNGGTHNSPFRRASHNGKAG